MRLNKWFVTVLATIFITAVCSVSTVQAKKAAVKKDVDVKNIPVPGSCSDPAATMLISKTLKGSTATITMKGTVCNMGQADYAGQAPLDAHYMVYTWHTPKTPAQEHDLKTISHTSIAKKLKKGDCKIFTQTYKIPGVTKWGHTVETQTERPASKQLVFRVEKKYPMQPGDTDFSKTEDCDSSNNAAEQTIDYMEKK